MLKKAEALETLGVHLPTLRRCLHGGWRAWKEHYTARHHVLDARARAAIVYCEIIHRAKELFAEDNNVKIVQRRWMYLLFFGDDIVLRFKKLRKRKPSNVKTKQQLLLDLQQPLPTILPNTNIIAGYELDPLQQAVESTLVVARLDGEEKWSIDLNLEEGAAEGKIEMMSPQPQEPRRPSRVRAKAGKAKKQTKQPEKE